MYAGEFLQMLGGSNATAKATSTQNLRNQSAGNCSNETFKKEMDKVFDRKQSTKTDVDKNSRIDKKDTSKEVQHKENSNKQQGNGTDCTKENQNTDVTPEELALAAAQIQQQVVIVQDYSIDTCDEVQKTQGTTGTDALLGMVAKEVESNLTGNFSSADKEGEIKLPFQNNADLAKLAMVKPTQDGGQESQMQNFTETMTKGSQVQGEKVQKSVNAKADTQELQEFGLENDEPTIEPTDIQEENVLMKNNNLDLSKVNIKVADAPIDTNQADMAKQLADKIMYKISDGKQEFDLELNPRNLGKVNIKMIFQNGSAEIILSTSNSKAHQLLSMQADALRAILEANTGMDNTISLKQAETADGQFDRDNFQEQSNGQQNQQKNQEKKLAEDVSFIDKLRLGLVDDFEEAI